MKLITADTKYIVVGLGVTGFSCVRYLRSAGKQVEVCDSRQKPPNLHNLQSEFPDVPVRLGDWDSEYLSTADVLVMSPGVPLATPAIQAALQSGARVTCDIELFLAEFTGTVVAITGSNAKSTVTSWLGEAIAADGKHVLIAGNIGRPVLDGLDGHYDVAVLELSSFQLELIAKPAVDIATVLNVSEDHLDRYPSFAAYQQAKQRIYFGCQRAVFNRSDLLTQPLLPDGVPVTSFALDEPDLTTFGVRTDDSGAYLAKGFTKLLPVSALSLPGQHNVENALAVYALAEALALSTAAIEQALTSFKGLRHRCELVAEVAGVRYFNDSKATNIGSTLAAIRGLGSTADKNILLLLGGQSKGQNLAPLKPVASSLCKAIYAFGEDAEQFGTLLPKAVLVETLAEALAHARSQAVAGDLVLLSPACASFDQYPNFEARGDAFVAWVEALQ